MAEQPGESIDSTKPKTILDCCPTTRPSVRNSAWTLDLELITPMVGGGFRAGEYDAKQPIRGTSIRGHLRHWWRIIRGFSLGEAMFRREEEIFGSVDFPSPIQVIVTPPKTGEKIKSFPIHGIKGSSTRGYVLFPSIDKGQNLLKEDLSFQVRVAVATVDELADRRRSQNAKLKPNQQLPSVVAPIDEDVKLAIQAWVTFGGLGARTRRGCGAIRLKQASFESTGFSAEQRLEMLKPYLPAGTRLFRLSGGRDRKPLESWDHLIETLKMFRAGMPLRGDSLRKKFPEDETLRRHTRRRKRPQSDAEKRLPEGFPRAELGLPIVFQFKDSGKSESMNVLPDGTDSKGNQLNRMASPVILRPLAIANGNAVGLILVLPMPRVSQVVVAGEGNAADRSRVYPVVDPRFKGYPNSPLEMTAHGSAIEAFIKFAMQRGYEEVR